MKTVKKLDRKLLVLLGLVGLAMCGGTATSFAWITVNTTVDLDGVGMSLHGADSLIKIASGNTTVQDSDWKDSLSIECDGLKLSPVRLRRWTDSTKQTDPKDVPFGNGTTGKVFFAVPNSVNSDGTAGSGETIVNDSTDKTYFKRIDFQIKNFDDSYWNDTPNMKMEATNSTLTFKITLSGTYKPIHKALRFYLINYEVKKASSYGVNSYNEFAFASAGPAAGRASHYRLAQNGFGTETFTHYAYNFYANSRGKSNCYIFKPIGFTLFLYVCGDDPNCVSANAVNFGGVNFKFEIGDIVVNWTPA